MTRIGPLVFLFCSFISWVWEAEGQSQSPPINVNNELELGTGIDDERDAMDVRTVMPSSWHRNPLAAVLRNTHAVHSVLFLFSSFSAFFFCVTTYIPTLYTKLNSILL